VKLGDRDNGMVKTESNATAAAKKTIAQLLSETLDRESNQSNMTTENFLAKLSDMKMEPMIKEAKT